jgi:hypothetical protein
MYKVIINGDDKVNRYIHVCQHHIKSKSKKNCTLKEPIYSYLSDDTVCNNTIVSKYSVQINRTPSDK